MKTKYREIFKLKKMLEDSNIPFDWIQNWGYSEEKLKTIETVCPDLIEHYQICYPKGSYTKDEQRWISVIEGFGTFGAEQDKLEIMGGLTIVEKYEENEVIGYLTAKNVFKRIKNHYEGKVK